ncbi:SDR family oxidoreductase [Thalassotalea psychrophila]|uniref:SDR family oxidoreductase n=1 Tax=Thalassotalea psychrophila TaxID=3065647 RepID=A0ABY9TTN0_9GAMM|nr:SDR family oxidoreductase [Colwelliaceae bacterium SQ149]
MKNLWNNQEASKLKTDLDLRVYTSRLIGADTEMVLHGGGNTSLKSTTIDRFGETKEIIWVKASGFDLATMGAEGYTALEIEKVIRLAELKTLSDEDMVSDLKVARLNPNAAGASIEAIVHALIPFKYVDHTHANAVLTISNSPNGLTQLKNIYGDDVLFLPYIKPGFDLALQFQTAINNGELKGKNSVILEHHGVFTFSDDAKTSYDNMVNAVEIAESFLLEQYGESKFSDLPDIDPVSVAEYRKAASDLAGQALLSRLVPSIAADKTKRITQLLRNGTLTPEHVLHNKPFPALLQGENANADMKAFEAEYQAYFQRANDSSLQMLKPHPHWAVFESGQCRSFGINLKRATISADVAEATLQALQYADKLGGWQGLTEQDLRDIEYWTLEQAKLKSQKAGPELTGKIAVVSGAAAGIGLACAKALYKKGAVVIGLDINPEILNEMNKAGFEGKVLNLTDESAIKIALAEVVNQYGGIDILVSNAGIFRTGKNIEHLDDDNWDSTLAVNLTSHRLLLKQAIPFLRHGVNPSVVFMGSRNVPAPGAGAAAYSVSKAGLTQLMRVAALELVKDGITVNAIHPDAVFDTKLWTQEALDKSAKRYGITVEEYKRRNLLSAEITSHDIALAVTAFVDGTLSKSTGVQLSVDGGNERVI